ncbi:MAG TPA: ABC transporter ATP-binding protein [Burkholderiales bacterium]
MTTSNPVPPPVLDAQGIGLSYQRAREAPLAVLRDFTLHLGAGEVVAVLGPSGAGKSSLLRVLAGLQAPDRGQVRVHGEPLHGPHPRLGFVFQDPCLLPWLTVEQNVAFGLDFRHQPRISAAEKQRRVEAAIAEVDLLPARRRYPAELSGGMAQRAALARGLAREPQILLLDEPFSALDAITRGEMQALLRRLIVRHRTAAVLVTHDIDEALVVADRVLLIGHVPARLLRSWRIELPHPREDALAELAALRAEIAQTLRAARRGAPLPVHLAA